MREPVSRTNSDSLAGCLLLAHPVLRDENFRRTVILMSAHNSEGAMGVVINRPLGKTLGEFGGDFALGPLSHVPVYAGGPVERRLLILCAWRPGKDADAGDDQELELLFGIDPVQATLLVEEDGVELRAYLGFAGWSGGQLEGELARDTWVVARLEPDVLRLKPDESLWRAVLGRLDPRWRLLAGEPDDLEMN